MDELTFENMDKEESMLYKKIEKLVSIDEVDKMKNDLILSQKENQITIGIPGKHHSEQSNSVLQNTKYWEFSNFLQLLELKRKSLNGEIKTFVSFSGGGSIGVGYLGHLMKDLERGELPDVIFGLSAGSLFPALFLLWKKAKEINPEKIGNGLDSILKILPSNLEGKTMFFNGEELIENFRKSGQNLINIINEKLSNEEKLPNIEEISIDQISQNFKIIATRKTETNNNQEVIFGGKDLLLSSIIASSNPELSIFGIKLNVLTNSKNKFYSNEWVDGYHSTGNHYDYADILGIKNFKEYISLKNYSFINKKEFSRSTTYVPDIKNFLIGRRISQYSDLDQNDGWGLDNMKLKIIMSYYRNLSYSNIGFFLEDVEKNIKDTELINTIYDILLNNKVITYNIGNISKIDESVIKINNLIFINSEQKEKLILNLFYNKNYVTNITNCNIEYECLSSEYSKLKYILINELLDSIYLPYGIEIDGKAKHKYINKNSTKYILDYIITIDFNKGDENYEKIILELISKEKIIELLSKNIGNQIYYSIFIDLFYFTSIFDNIDYKLITKILINIYNSGDKEKDEKMFDDYLSFIKTILTLKGRENDFIKIVRDLEENDSIKIDIDQTCINSSP